MSPADDLNALFLSRLRSRLEKNGHQVDVSSQYAALVVNKELEIASGVLPGEFHPFLTPFVVFTIHQDLFEEGIEESIVGIGETDQQKVDFAVENYTRFILPAILESMSDSHDPGLDFESICDGQKVLWHPKPSEDLFQGQWEDSDCSKSLYSLAAENISNQLSLRKVNWLKLYVAKQPEGELAVDCLLNNSPWPEGISLLEAYAKTWPDRPSFRSQKQLIMFRRCDSLVDS